MKRMCIKLTILVIVLAYLLGSIPSAVIIGKVFFNVDIREHGSKNPGASNSLRVFGKKFAFIILIMDVSKGALAALLPLLFQLDLNPIYPGLAAVIGHCFPIFANFRGGKAIATTAGMLLVVNIYVFLIGIVGFFGIILITKYVFMASISVGFLLIGYSIYLQDTTLLFVFVLFQLLLIYLHRSNITNFFNGEELKTNDKRIFDARVDVKK